MPLDAAGDAHRLAIAAWEDGGRDLGDGLLGAMDAGGLSQGAGLYTDGAQVLQLAAVTSQGLLTDPARIGMCGRHVRDLPLDADYTAVVARDITGCRTSPILTRAAIAYGNGSVARYQNLRLPLAASRRVLSLTVLEAA